MQRQASLPESFEQIGKNILFPVLQLFEKCKTSVKAHLSLIPLKQDYSCSIIGRY